jgi:hypothetical protein
VSRLQGNPDLYVISADGGDQAALTMTPVEEQEPAWQP